MGITCPYCGSREVFYDEERGEYVCRVCGSVVEERIAVPSASFRSAPRVQRAVAVTVETRRVGGILRRYRYLSGGVSMDGDGRRVDAWANALVTRLGFPDGAARRIAEELGRTWRFRDDPVDVLDCIINRVRCGGHSMDAVHAVKGAVRSALGMDLEDFLINREAVRFKIGPAHIHKCYRALRRLNPSYPTMVLIRLAVGLVICNGDLSCAEALMDAVNYIPKALMSELARRGDALSECVP